MNTRNRPLLALALTAACLSPLALAQDRTTQELDATVDTATEATMPPPVNDADPRPIDPEVDAMTQPPQPPREPVSGPDRTVQRSRWAELDTDGDGRISTQEGAVQAEFGANFEMMDRDGDGFIDQTEFDGTAQAETETETEVELEEEDE